MRKGPEARRDDLGFDRIEIVDLHADVIERPALGKVLGGVGDVAPGIERDVVVI